MKKTKVCFLAVMLTLIFCTSKLLVKAEDFQDIVFIEVEEISPEPGIVSAQAKQFRLKIHHSPSYVPAEKIESFDRKKSPILTSLQIIGRDLDRDSKNPENIRGDFEFNLEADSSPSTKYENFLETHYLSNSLIFKKATRINFKIELFDYLDDQQDIETKNLITKVNDKLDIKSLELSFNDLYLNGDSLTFTSKNSKKLSKIQTEEYILKGLVETSLDLSDSVKNISFRDKDNRKLKAKIKKDGTKSKQSQKLKPETDEDKIRIYSSDSGNYRISIPVSYKSKKKLTKAQRVDIEKMDLLVTPIFLVVKTGDGRDLKLNGILRDKVSIIYDNGNTIKAEIK